MGEDRYGFRDGLSFAGLYLTSILVQVFEHASFCAHIPDYQGELLFILLPGPALPWPVLPLPYSW